MKEIGEAVESQLSKRIPNLSNRPCVFESATLRNIAPATHVKDMSNYVNPKVMPAIIREN
jgi:hypothetical protein